jgi:hypothetical protein
MESASNIAMEREAVGEQIAIDEPASTLERAFAAAGVTAMLGGSAFVAAFDPSNAGFFPVCPLYSLTGIACPGCGLTRGFHALFHGDVLTALDHNAMIPAFIVLFGSFFLSMFLVAVRGRGLSPRFYAPRLMWVFLVSLAVFGLLRNLPFFPFSVLYP